MNVKYIYRERHLLQPKPKAKNTKKMWHMITGNKTCLKPTRKPSPMFDEESRGSGGKREESGLIFKMWQTHAAIWCKSRGNLGKFSCNLWINSCNWPWELKMCHMFLVPVFEMGSLRTFIAEYSHGRSESRRRGREDGERERSGKTVRGTPGMRDGLVEDWRWMDR